MVQGTQTKQEKGMLYCCICSFSFQNCIKYIISFHTWKPLLYPLCKDINSPWKTDLQRNREKWLPGLPFCKWKRQKLFFSKCGNVQSALDRRIGATRNQIAYELIWTLKNSSSQISHKWKLSVFLGLLFYLEHSTYV